MEMTAEQLIAFISGTQPRIEKPTGFVTVERTPPMDDSSPDSQPPVRPHRPAMPLGGED